MIIEAKHYSVHSTVRDIYPWLSALMGMLLIVSFVGFLVVTAFHGSLPYTDLVKSSFAASLMFFVLTGAYWKGYWTWVITGKAEKLSRRLDYFEIDEDEYLDLCHHTCEYTGSYVEFRGIHSEKSPPAGRLFVHFDNEQDRILFRLANR